MVVVKAVFFNSDDLEINVDVYPAEDIKSAKEIVEKIYNKIFEDELEFEDEEEEESWVENNVTRYEDGSIFINGYDGGFADLKIMDMITNKDLSTLKVKSYIF